jgi:hypothetical protein
MFRRPSRFARRGSSTCDPHHFAPPIAYRGLVAGLARRRSPHVLIGSSKLGPSRSLPFARGSKLSTSSHWVGERSLIAANFLLPDSQVPDACDRVPSEEVSHAPDCLLNRWQISREPGVSATPDLSPVTRNYLGVTLTEPLGSVVSLSFCQRTEGRLPNQPKKRNKNLSQNADFQQLVNNRWITCEHIS